MEPNLGVYLSSNSQHQYMLESYLKRLRQMSQKHPLSLQQQSMLLEFHHQLILEYEQPYAVLVDLVLGNLLAMLQQ